MKAIAVLSLPLFVSGAVVQHELYRRQKMPGFDLFGLSVAKTKPEKPVTQKKLTASLQEGAIKEQVVWGPFKLQAANGTHAAAGTVLKLDKNSDIISTRVAGLCKECMVLFAKADLADKDGNKVDVGSGVYSHHVIMTSLKGQRMAAPPVFPKCPNGRVANPFGGMVAGAPKDNGAASGHGHVKAVDAAEAPAQTPAQTPAPKAASQPAAQTPATKAPPPGAPVNTAAPAPAPKGSKDGGIFDIAGTGPTPPPVAPSPPPGLVIPGTGVSIPGLPSIDSLGPILGATAGSALGAIVGTLLGAPLGALLGVAASSDIGKQILGGGSSGVSPVTGLSPGSLGAGLSNLAPSFAVFIGQGDEGSGLTYHAESDKFKAGFYLGKETELNLLAEVINYNAQEKDIYVKVEYEYLPNMPNRPKEYYDVGMGAINVSPCESWNLMPPNDRAIKYTSPAWSVHADGYLMDIRPHLHDGGVNMTFYVNGEKACTSEAIYGGTDGGWAVNGEKWETITSYSRCPDPVKIKVGDSVTMDAYYDLTKHRLRPKSDHSGEAEGMALANFIFAKPSQ